MDKIAYLFSKYVLQANPWKFFWWEVGAFLLLWIGAIIYAHVRNRHEAQRARLKKRVHNASRVVRGVWVFIALHLILTIAIFGYLLYDWFGLGAAVLFHQWVYFVPYVFFIGFDGFLWWVWLNEF